MSEAQSTLPVLSASVPKPSQPWGARKIAEVCLQIIERTGRFADEVFVDVTAGLEVSDRERSLAFELVLGVLRHYITLDWRLNQVSRKPMARPPLNGGHHTSGCRVPTVLFGQDSRLGGGQRGRSADSNPTGA